MFSEGQKVILIVGEKDSGIFGTRAGTPAVVRGWRQDIDEYIIKIGRHSWVARPEWLIPCDGRRSLFDA